MKLRSITLKDVRRFTDPVRIDGISDGVNVLSAPNEHGKSTVFDALRALFFMPYGSTKKDIRHLRPLVGGAPEVSVEVETSEGRFQISKRWFSKAEARIVRDGTLIAQADEAEAWIARLLDAGSGGPSGLLWVRQGVLGLSDGEKGEQTAALEARRDLLSSVTGEVEAMTGGRRMDAALARCRDELTVFATGTGRPKAGGPWAAALQDTETLAAERDRLADHVAQLQTALDLRNQHRRELAELDAPDAVQDRQTRLGTARQTFEAAQAHADRIKAAEQSVQTAALMADRATQRLRALQTTLQAKASAEAAAQKMQRQLAAATEARDEAERALTDAVTAHDAAETERKTAEGVLRHVQNYASAQATRDRRAELEDRLDSAQSARTHLEAAKATASVGPDDKDMETLRTLSAALTTARALRDSTATRVTMRYATGRDGSVHQAGTALGDGEAITIHSDTVLHLDGLGDLSVHPGERPTGMADVFEAEASLAEGLAAIGATTIEDATRAWQTRRDTAALVSQLDAEFKALAPHGIAALQTQLAALPASLTEQVADLPPSEQAEAALQSATGKVAELKARMDVARDQRDTARTDHAAAVVRHEEAALRQSTAIEAANRLADQDEAQLATQAAEAEAQRQRAADALSAAQSAAPDIGAAQAALARAQSIEDGARARIGELRPAIAALDERIRGSAGKAVEEQLQDTEDKLEAAQARLARITREVKVLERLQRALEAARSEARDRYFEPVAGELRPLLKLLWPDAELNWADDTLLPSSLIRDGQEETVEILSGGTREQIALLVRLAFARLLAKDGRHAPVILDDALVFTDDDRIERMFDALHRQAGDLQILVLSCRQRAFRDLGGKTLQIVPGDLA